jgi:Ca-activated chloride channel family protein
MTASRWVKQPLPVVLAAAVWGFSCSAPALPAQADFQVDVNLVVLHVTVTDHAGRFIRDVPRSAFHVYEDGVPQQITLFKQEDAPVAVGLVVDNSGSMRRKLPDVVAAAASFARSSNPQDQMFVVNFNERVSLGLPPGEAFVSDPDELKAALLRIQADGRTALYDALAKGLEHIRASPIQKKVLIVLSDGGDNASRHTFPQILRLLQESNVIVYTVGLYDEYDEDRNPGVLRRLAKVSGGQAFFPKEIPATTSVLQAISSDIRNQYTIGYVPTTAKAAGTFHTVQVKVTAPHSNGWTVRTRTGYIATEPASTRSQTQKANQP